MDLPEGPCDVGYYCPIGQIVSAPPEYKFVVVYILTTNYCAFCINSMKSFQESSMGHLFNIGKTAHT